MDTSRRRANDGGVRSDFSWRVLLTLLAMLALAAGTFAELVRQWTGGARASAMREWARVNGFRRVRGETAPEALAASGLAVRIERQYARGGTVLARVWARGPGGGVERAWHVLICQSDRPAEAVGLRPTREGAMGAGGSVIDWYGLPTFARLSAGRRFEVVGRDAKAAARLADGPARALLPADVGLLRLRDHLLLDFSARPFDPIELNRMLAIAEQVATVSG